MVHRQGTGRLAGDGHAVRIAPERGDVPPDPAQRGDLVLQTEVAGRIVSGLPGDPGQRQEAEHPKPIIDRHHDDAARGQRHAVVNRHGAGAADESAAVDPYQHRKSRGRMRRRPNVEKETVLADRAAHQKFMRPGGRNGVGDQLPATGAEFLRGAHAAPRHRRTGCPPPARAGWRSRIGNAAIGIDGGHRGSGHESFRGTNHRIRGSQILRQDCRKECQLPPLVWESAVSRVACLFLARRRSAGLTVLSRSRCVHLSIAAAAAIYLSSKNRDEPSFWLMHTRRNIDNMETLSIPM